LGYFSTVLADGPVEWWRLSDPGGVICNNVGSGTRIALSNELNGAMPYTGMNSDGTCCAHQLGFNIIDRSFNVALSNPWTLEAWAWLFAIDAGDDGILGLQTSGGGIRIGIRQQAAGTVIGFVAGQPSAGDATVLAAQAWHQYALSYDGAVLTLYLDGVAHGSQAFAQSTTGTYEIVVLDEFGAASIAWGFAQDVAIYHTALSAARILAHFNAADTISSKPVYAGGGKYPSPTNGSITLAQLEADLEAFVSRLYQNAP